MSALGAGSGKERSGAINLWIFILLAALFVLAANFYFSAARNAEENKARARLTDVQVLSQKIATFAQAAAAGTLEAFDELQATRDRIQLDLDVLKQGSGVAAGKVPEAQADEFAGIPGYEAAPGVSEELKALGDVWAPISANAQTIIDNKELVLGLNDTAAAFSATVPQLSAQMDEVVRAMGESNATSTQIYTANRQVVLANNMLRHVTEILQGGAGAVSAADRFSRDASMFGQVLTGLQNGSAEQGIARVASAQARNTLEQVTEQYNGVQADVERILDASTQLLEIKEASDEILRQSADLLQGAQKLSVAYDDLPTSRAFPSLWVGLVAGAAAIFGIAGSTLR